MQASSKAYQSNVGDDKVNISEEEVKHFEGTSMKPEMFKDMKYGEVRSDSLIEEVD